MTDKFCTKMDVIGLLPVNTSITKFDDLIVSCIMASTKAIKNFTRKDFVTAIRTEYHNVFSNVYTRSSFLVFLKESPIDIAETFSIKLAKDYDWDNTEVLDTKYYTVNAAKGSLQISAIVDWSQRDAMQIMYTAGYDRDVDDTELVLVGDDLKMACAMQTAYLVDRIVNQQTGQKDKQGRPIPSQLAVSAIETLIPQAISLIRDYRRNLVGG